MPVSRHFLCLIILQVKLTFIKNVIVHCKMKQPKTRAFWHYYRITSIANLVYSSIFAAIKFDFIWLFLIYGTFGTGVGILFFNYYYKNQYYFYHNLGYTRRKLALNTFLVNIPLFIIGLILFIIS